MAANVLTDQGFELIFRSARTHNGWLDKPVSDDLLHKIYDDFKWGPTSANSSPLRVVFLKTPEAKARLKPALSVTNVDKTLSAPVTAILAHDMQFHDHLPFLFPHADAKSWFAGNDKMIADTAFRNGSLQAAYLMIAARAHGLDCGPMSGFDAAAVDAEFFKDGCFKTNFLCNLGYGDAAKLFPRSPRFAFDDVCSIL
ncbi:MAG: malonic semialdehyde reductase [Micavibrio sp.]|nr:malonic semialdehyde reductase [Micavibrio sp.]